MNQFMNKLTKPVAIAIAFFFLSACAGRQPNLVMVNQYGDHQKSCRMLKHEMKNVRNEIQSLLPNKDKTGKNIALGVAGAFLLVPWFFMDFKNAEAQEYEAYRKRYNHLAMIANEKRCGNSTTEFPSIRKLKEDFEAEKKKKQQDTND